MPDRYFVCATPRTGSTLLCGLLASSGVAGRPESYFRSEDHRVWAERFGLELHAPYLAFVRAAQARGTTDNGVFAARIMWGTIGPLIDALLPAGTKRGRDIDVLRAVFGELAFVYLWRDDVIAQAVSWARAEQSGVWHVDATSSGDGREAPVAYDRARIEQLATTIDAHNQAWREWFAHAGVDPHEVRYEDLEAAPVTTAQRVLDALAIVEARLALQVRDVRLRDDTSAEWIERYREGG